ncbi:MAG: HAD family hydrolase [Actinomycetota bacterium]
MAYRAVLFDAGETLLAPHPSFPDLFAAVMGGRGHSVTPAQVEVAVEKVAPSFVEILERTGSKTWSTSREVSRRFWGTIYAAIFEHLGISDSTDSHFEALYERFTRHDSYRLFPDTLPTLQAMKEAGLLLGIVSNWEEWLEGLLVTLEVAALFDAIVISGREGVEKPDPGIFRLGLERLGTVAESAVYVGDHPRLDMAAATEVGMAGILIDRRGRYADFPGVRIRSLAELPALLGV